MGNASRTSSKIWRTVVVAGAMLGTPLAGGCGGKKAAPVAKPADPPKTDAADGSGSAATGEATDPEGQERPRKPDDERPIGRGFILA
ncbi:MAG: hypothetical protein KF773_28550 [Deltaproteobacteria bacterium]|nr:hypothetical protein [Deltaproteobacteria bacterium]MCW5801845.1 hypothetical protein [Deltaproteobacteria bacterium]